MRRCAPAEGLTRHPIQGGVCDRALPYVNSFIRSRLRGPRYHMRSFPNVVVQGFHLLPVRPDATVCLHALASKTSRHHVVFSLAKGKVITEEEMSGLIERADAEKLNKAIQRLERAVPTVPENVR